MELYVYILFLTIASYHVISMIYQKLVTVGPGFSTLILKGRETVFVGSAIILLLILASVTALSSANLAFNYDFLILGLTIGIPLGWMGVKISHAKPAYGFYIFNIILIVIGLIFRLS